MTDPAQDETVATGRSRDRPPATGFGRPAAVPSEAAGASPHWEVRDRQADRTGGHGGRLPGVRPGSRARGGPQGHAPGDGGRPGAETAVREGGSGGRPPQSSRHRDRLRPGVSHRRLSLHRDGAAQGPGPPGKAAGGSAAVARAEGLDRHPGTGRPRSRAQGGDRPSRHQAGQHLPDRRGRGPDHGFRHRVLDRFGSEESGGARDGEVHVPGAGSGRSGGRPERPLQRRHAPPRDPHRPSPLRRRDTDGDLPPDRARRGHHRAAHRAGVRGVPASPPPRAGVGRRGEVPDRGGVRGGAWRLHAE